MIASVERSIASQELALPGQPMWVAVSGGVDSMVLLDALRKLGHVCHVAHVDHGLRGAESAADLHFVEAHCKAKHIPFSSTRVDLSELISQGRSVQMAARELRYEWFNSLVDLGPSVLATAHHADDAVETLLMDMMQGIGPSRWGSIPPRNGPFVRPLLQISRKEILEYAEKYHIAFREDRSNTDPKYLRNRVRHEVLPLLEEVRPGTRIVMQRNVQLLREMTVVLGSRLNEAMMSLIPDSHGALRVPFELLRTSHMPGLILHRLLRDKGYHPDRIADILSAIETGNTGAHFMDGGYTVVVDRDELIMEKVQPTPPEFRIGSMDDLNGSLPISVSIVDAKDMDLDQGNSVAWLDAVNVPFPWTLRPWKPGDRMNPIGLGGSKLVSDLLIDQKTPRNVKERTYVLVARERIVWLCGHRIAEGSQGSDFSDKVLRITWKGI
ncbi:MAG: tRNA lysidine(34) synthetase TilS [Flavobacteriales bacterium]|nr:tRNA lysidine(34) synthetase TilS [Flavobacteriales bacterium]MBK6943621.1 tRNA lysidine(34) synthetase TilS [Flavobacteriales bacterium]MBK7297173.1 tRNA lysidine(34) synthetase TilS [Flavobacteriales bacterium]MBK9535851.1 tRNA lysidine(34) synthetase TilS [Flavobacteriales bacterium]MBP9138573.1 tRNA lysidine(34) synthetase TilS [Flavobacteriales bacterium]